MDAVRLSLASSCAPSAKAIGNRVWRRPAKAREPYDNQVVKRWTAEIAKSTVAAARPLANRWGPLCLARKWIANCKPIDRLAVSHVLRVKRAGASMERGRDDE